MKIFTSIMFIFFCSISFGQDIEIQSFATGFNNPINIKNAGGTDDRLYVVEQAGIIKILNSDGVVNTSAFLNISSIVTSGGERGLLGLAFHPNYVSNGYFYVNYINTSGNTVISRFSRSATDETIADQNSELQLLTYSQPYTNHNGGDMAFGPDGFLYISSGDGGAGGDPGNRAQSVTNLLGKILRIDVDGDSNGNYGIPADNPYFGSTSAMPEIWAYGLRNPWKFSFDRDTGDLWIADVGQNEIEEINMVPSTVAGLNYGWRCYEGNSIFNSSGCPASSSLTFPIAQYSHFNDGAFKCSITGGYRYRGTSEPNLNGLYFFADYCSDEIGILEQSGDNWNMTFTTPFTGNGWTTFGEDINGELYIAGIDSGTVYKIVSSTLNVEEHEIFDLKIFPNPATNSITLGLDGGGMQIKSINIFSIHGKLVSTISNIQESSVNISTKDFKTGMYFVEVITNEGLSVTKKLIKI